MTQATHQIQVTNLSKVFGSRPERALAPEHADKSRAEIQDELDLVFALRNVSFEVDEGEIFVIMGLSGSGKSTLVRTLIRLIDATDGEIWFEGENILDYDSDELIEFRRNKVAMVFQHYGLLPHRRVMDNVAYGLEIQGMGKDERYAIAAKAIETVGLSGWEDYYPREMSGGMQQRVGLARALAVNPDVLLMDEPFSGLDPLIRREMQDELIALQHELQQTIVFITHDLNEALKIGNRIAIMRDGEIVQLGPPEEIVTKPADDYVADFVQDVSRTRVIQSGAIMQKPADVVYDWQGPNAALRVMRSADLDIAFVLGHGRILRGILTEDLAAKLTRQGVEKLEGVSLEPVMTTSPETFIEEIIPMAAETEHPIAVVDDEGKLLGEIHRGALLAGIADTGQEDEPIHN